MKLILERWNRFTEQTLQEKRWEDLGADKGEWTELSAAEIESSKDPENIDIADQLYTLIYNAYKKIGGNYDYKSPEDLPGKADYWSAVDLDDDPEPDALVVGKTKGSGLKYTAAGQDGFRPSIDSMLDKTGEMLNTLGIYGEFSKGLAKRMLVVYKVPHIEDPDVVQKVLGPTKPIIWLGAHPEGKYPGINGWYTRQIGGEEALKIMLGKPNV